MCGRFVRKSSVPVIVKRFNVEKVLLPEVPPSYNISPDQDVLIINHEQNRQLLSCRWGFIPSWIRDISDGVKMINARAETVADKPAFRHSLRKHRCLVVADGFFEWGSYEGRKNPFYIRLKSEEPFGLAGMTSLWESPDGSVFFTCTIITTEPNELIKKIHHRMPVIIPKGSEDLWLESSIENKSRLLSLLKPYPSEDMDLYAVSSRVNSPLYDSPDNVQPI